MRRTFSLLILSFGLLFQNLHAGDERLTKAYQLLQENKYHEAIDIYTTLLRTDSTNEDALYNVGFSYRALGEHDSSLYYYNAVRRLYPNSLNTYEALAELYGTLGQYPMAIECLSAYIARDSSNPMVYYNRSVCNIKLDNRAAAYEDAMQCRRAKLDSFVSEKVDFILYTLGHRNPKAALKTFRDKKGILSIDLPKEWHIKTTDDDKVMQMFISAEKVEKESDMFTLGCTVTFIRRISKTVPGLEGKDPEFVAGVWEAFYDKGALGVRGYDNYFYHKELSNDAVTVKDRTLHQRIMDLQLSKDSYRLKSCVITTSFDDNICTIVYEAPAKEFDAFLPLFKRSIASLVFKAP